MRANWTMTNVPLFFTCNFDFDTKAISSLKKYPLPLKNGREAKILQNFGDGICKLLDDRLLKHYKEHGKSERGM